MPFSLTLFCNESWPQRILHRGGEKYHHALDLACLGLQCPISKHRKGERTFRNIQSSPGAPLSERASSCCGSISSSDERASDWRWWPNPILTSKREVGGCLSVVTLFESSSLTHQVASSKLILFRPDDHKFYELGVLLFESCNLKRVAGNICERCWGIYSDRLMYENGIWPLFSRNSPASCLMMIIVPICSCSA